MQYRAQTQAYGDQFPNACYFVIERLGDPIGRLILDVGRRDVRVVDIAFVPEARGRGFGTQILKGVQMAAAEVRAPLTLSVSSLNAVAKRLYLRLGFRVAETGLMVELLAWYPAAE